MSENKKKKKHRILNNNFFRLIVALLIMAMCAGIGAGIAVYEDKSDPMDTVAVYFGKFLMKKYDDMYDLVETEGKYVPKESFKLFMRDLRNSTVIGDYEFDEPKKVGDRYLVRVKYKHAETGANKFFDIYLVSKRENAFQIVGDWKISIDDYMEKDFEVIVPNGMKLSMDGKEVSRSEIANLEVNSILDAEGKEIVIEKETPTEDNVETENQAEEDIIYKFDEILKGTHTLKIENDFVHTSMEVDIIVPSQKMKFDVNQLEIKKEYINMIEESATGMIQDYYENVGSKKKPGKELKAYFAEDKALQDKLKKQLAKDQKIVYWEDVNKIEDYSMTKCDFSELKNTIEYIGNGEFSVVYDYEYDYQCETETELYSSVVYELSGKCKTTMELTYKYEDGKMKITDIKIKNKNKKNENEVI